MVKRRKQVSKKTRSESQKARATSQRKGKGRTAEGAPAETADFESTLKSLPESLPVLPAKDIVAFPSVMMSLYVGRDPSVKAVNQSQKTDNFIFLLAQKNQETEDPEPRDLYRTGVIASVARTLKLPDGRYKVLLQGVVRAVASSVSMQQGCLVARVKPIIPPNEVELTVEDMAIINRIKENLQILVEYEHIPEEMLLVTGEIEEPGTLSDVILAHYKLDIAPAQQALEQLDPMERLKFTDAMITDDLNQFMLSEKIKDKARDELTKGQRDYYLREQLKQIQRELGEGEGTSDDLSDLRKALEKAKLPALASAEATKQFRRLDHMHPESSEYALLRTYLEWLSDLPWSKTTKDRVDLARAKTVLDEDHFGLDRAKDRILEYLSVRKLNPASKGPILCFVGPPGVGKTSLGRSIARALGRTFVRMSLGGMRDEAEIRGHRRTYVGALPGRIIQGIKQAASRNPVFVLDELDKIGADFRGDPASALLEVLDPQQNKDFRDHYLNVGFDLSETVFIATANTIDTIPDALLDRLELISISGYTTHEKMNIAKKYLIPRQMTENGLGTKSIPVSDSTVLFLIERYTREAGVRNLEREIGSLLRKIAREFAETKRLPKRIDEKLIVKLLGNTKFDPDPKELKDVTGLAQGLAWTVHGGEVMPVEASIAKGNGTLQLTGQLGSVMQESARAAMFFARANAKVLALDPEFHSTTDIHIHVPAGATPKDGPSAGITIAAALVSALSKRSIARGIAMTGEMTLRGNVLAVGGIKEKALAALQRGIRKVIIPFENLKDLDEIPKEQREKIKFLPVKHISEVLEIVLARTRPSAETRRKIKPITAKL